jgi:hypothetical protein
MNTRISLGIMFLSSLAAACEPETFRGRAQQPSGGAGIGGLTGAAGLPDLTGAAGMTATGAAGIPALPTGEAGMGPAGTGGPAGTTGAAGQAAAGMGGGAAGMTTGAAGMTAGAAGMTAGAAGMNGAAGMGQAGTGGMRGTAGAGGTPGGNGADAGAGMMVRDAGVEAAPSVAYATTGWTPTASVTAAGNADQPRNAFDGMIGTRWATGRAQMGNETFTIDLGSAKPVSRVVLDDTTHPTDFPKAYTLEVSTNNTTYTNVKMGMGEAVTDIRFTQTMARYVRIRQTGMNAGANGSWWSIDELRIYP